MEKIIRIILERIGLGHITLLIVSVIIFSAVVLLPGDLAQQVLGQLAIPETVAVFREQLIAASTGHLFRASIDVSARECENDLYPTESGAAP